MKDRKFNWSDTTTTVLEGIDLKGKNAIVTGSTGGMGFEIARALSVHGANVTVIGRTEEKALNTIEKLKELTGNAFEYGILELDKFETVRRFCDKWLKTHEKLDMLINNAGIMCTPFELNEDGFEKQFATNHLGHFLLTNLLTGALLKAAPSRVVSVSSAGHFTCAVDFDDINFTNKKYSPVAAYGQSKTANVWFAYEYNKRYSENGINAYSLHPGGVQTDLGRYLDKESLDELIQEVSRLKSSEGGKSLEQGAATACYAATAPVLIEHGGRYLVNSHLATPGEYMDENHAPHAYDDDGALKLWEVSNVMLGTDF